MSRRIAFLVLAALAALIATPASADPECFGESCRLPEVVEPPAEAVPPPDPGDAAAPEAAAPEASAAVEKLAPVKVLPQVATSQVAKPKVAAAPVVRAPIPPMPPMQSIADETSALREPVQLAPRSAQGRARAGGRDERPAGGPCPLGARVVARPQLRGGPQYACCRSNRRGGSRSPLRLRPRSGLYDRAERQDHFDRQRRLNLSSSRHVILARLRAI